MPQPRSGKLLFALALEFAILTTLAVGGGLSMLPLVERAVVEKRRWLTREELVDCIAVVQSLPGLIACNLAVIIGYRVRGFRGALVALLSAIAMPIICLTIIAILAEGVIDSPRLVRVFLGIRAGTAALIALSLVGVARLVLKDALAVVLAVLAFVGAVVLRVDLALLVLMGMAVGVALIFVRRGKPEK